MGPNSEMSIYSIVVMEDTECNEMRIRYKLRLNQIISVG